jgi:hypothetical protein
VKLFLTFVASECQLTITMPDTEDLTAECVREFLSYLDIERNCFSGSLADELPIQSLPLNMNVLWPNFEFANFSIDMRQIQMPIKARALTSSIFTRGAPFNSNLLKTA